MAGWVLFLVGSFEHFQDLGSGKNQQRFWFLGEIGIVEEEKGKRRGSVLWCSFFWK